MRIIVPRFRITAKNPFVVLGLVAMAGTGCSSDFSRFDPAAYTATVNPNQNQQYQNPQYNAQAVNPYPGDLDPQTTASTQRLVRRPIVQSVNSSYARPPLPNADVGAVQQTYQRPSFVQKRITSNPVDQHSRQLAQQNARLNIQLNPAQSNRPVVYNTYNTYNTYQTKAANRLQSTQKQAQNLGQDYRQTAQIQRTQLPQLSKPRQLPTINAQPAGLKTLPAGVDPITTTAVDRASLIKPNRIQVQQNQKSIVKTTTAIQDISKGGWTPAGGTRITMRTGETLYNVSKRYGVPVHEVMRVNQITDANQVQAGQSLLIPTYVYSPNAKVSAPDDDIHTRHARSTIGQLGEADPRYVTTPDRRPSYYEPVSNNQNQSIARTKPVVNSGLAAMEPGKYRNDKKTGNTKTYRVVSGDTLGGIAARHGIKTASLMQANQLTNANIRVGQTLHIPGNSGLAPMDAGKYVSKNIDTKTTATINRDGPRSYTKPKITSLDQTASIEADTPDVTGIKTFRWPLKGRVVSKFGEKINGKTNLGIDISAPEGTAVRAAENGTVIYAGKSLTQYGNMVVVRHKGGWVSAYAYNSKLLVARNDVVKRGQHIAYSGKTGEANLPELHFELRKDSNAVNPQKWLR